MRLHWEESVLNTIGLMNTIDNILDHRHDSDFFERLQQWIDSVSYSRVGAEELLDLVLGGDIWEVYYKLLEEHRCFLTDEEIVKLKSNYKRIFDTPL